MGSGRTRMTTGPADTPPTEEEFVGCCCCKGSILPYYFVCTADIQKIFVRFPEELKLFSLSFLILFHCIEFCLGFCVGKEVSQTDRQAGRQAYIIVDQETVLFRPLPVRLSVLPARRSPVLEERSKYQPVVVSPACVRHLVYIVLRMVRLGEKKKVARARLKGIS